MIRKILVLSLWAPMLWAQGNVSSCYEFPRDAVEQIRQDVAYLASDELGGRKPGSDGDQLSREYIIGQFRNSGVEPYFKETYLQEFSVPNRVDRPNDGNYFRYKGDALPLDADYYPVIYSGNGSFKGETEYVSFGIESQKLDRDDLDDEDLKGAIAVMEISSPDGIHPHSKYKDWHDIAKRIRLLKTKGVQAVILVHTKGNANSPKSEFKSLESLGLPVIFVSDPKIAKKLRRSREVEGFVSLNAVEDVTYNVAGVINNGQRRTIIIGAHYDHLGFGGESSRYTGEEPMVHNGADDNASGVSGLLAMARFLAKTQDPTMRRFNYLLVAFSGEEMGLLGSKAFVERTATRQESWYYMFNMDMIGRMEDDRLAVNGMGTSPQWRDLVEPIECGLQFEFSESGVGPSDHTSFYYANIPALHFFTGTHPDYHKPSDDADKINVVGIYRVLSLMSSIIRNTPQGGDFVFSTTKVESTKAPKFSVTLGVMPDYLYSGNGMKIDGVSEGKPAAKAGLKAGDIVTQLGEVQVSDMQSYMQALAQFKKGDKATLLYQREGKVVKAQIQF
ncbi:M28 family peptidase [Croceimicrobium sp.]|uniref:M28 family peptidase n=1 Tax=Croceimicrobium sp. TaxID=2828340 RepID=UPI003BAC3436